MDIIKKLKFKHFLGAKGEQTCTGRRISPFPAAPYIAFKWIHSRLILARCKGCTIARCILSRSNGHEEYKHVNPFSLQKAHKAVRAGQYLQFNAAPYSAFNEICVHSRLILARYKGCTNGNCILSRSYGHEEFKNVNLFSVQKAHKENNISLPCSSVQCLQWKFSYIRDSS